MRIKKSMQELQTSLKIRAWPILSVTRLINEVFGSHLRPSVFVAMLLFLQSTFCTGYFYSQKELLKVSPVSQSRPRIAWFGYTELFFINYDGVEKEELDLCETFFRGKGV